jgi:hypothetical protein
MTTPSDRPVRIANGSGFFGDRFDAVDELLAGPDSFDVLTGDYLAELTMLILWKTRRREANGGYASTFLRQMENALGACLDRGIRIVSNAGGLNPDGLADALHALADRLGLSPRIAVVGGDDVLDLLPSLQVDGEPLTHLDTGQALAAAGVTPLTANAYLGGWGIARALATGADIVVCPRVTDAALVIGPAAWWHGWSQQDWDPLAGALVAGHVIECGAQATGGNYALIRELPDTRPPGMPIAEIAADGSSVITKQPGTGGLVSVGTVTAQLLYEIAEPAYVNPDVIARFETIQVSQVGPDRVAIAPTRGEAAPDRLKVAINFEGGFRNAMTLVLTGLDIDRKAKLAEAMLWERLGDPTQFDTVDVQLVRHDRADAPTNALATAELRITVKDADGTKVGRRFSNAVTELVLSNYAGLFPTTPPTPETMYGVYWPTLIPAAAVTHTVRLATGEVETIPHPVAPGSSPTATATAPVADVVAVWPAVAAGQTTRVPLGAICGARSGDKGGNANVGFWTWSDEAAAWLLDALSVDGLRVLLPEADGLEVRRFALPNLRAVNFVIVGLLGEGVASSTRADPQGKGLGEYLRSRLIDLPTSLILLTIPTD